MATSGTTGSTVIDTAKVIDHAVRRCGLTPSTLTPEDIETCLDNLFFILTSITNRGVNLWCIDKEIVGLAENRAKYYLQPGTIDVLSVNYRTTTALDHDSSQEVDSYTAEFTNAIAVKTIGIYYNTSRVHEWLIQVSNDGTTWADAADLGEVQGYAGQWTWHDIDPAYETAYFRLKDQSDSASSQVDLGVEQVRLVNTVREIELSAMSRDTYNSIPSKRTPGRPVQYYFNKQYEPELVIWPEPDDSVAHLVVRHHRQVQDVGTMQETLELPNRWFDAIIWALAKNLSYELSGVEDKRRLEIAAFAATTMQEAEDGETDGSPFFVQPKISQYTI